MKISDYIQSLATEHAIVDRQTSCLIFLEILQGREYLTPDECRKAEVALARLTATDSAKPLIDAGCLALCAFATQIEQSRNNRWWKRAYRWITRTRQIDIDRRQFRNSVKFLKEQKVTVVFLKED